jgi:hypothetical protein
MNTEGQRQKQGRNRLILYAQDAESLWKDVTSSSVKIVMILSVYPAWQSRSGKNAKTAMKTTSKEKQMSSTRSLEDRGVITAEWLEGLKNIKAYLPVFSFERLMLTGALPKSGLIEDTQEDLLELFPDHIKKTSNGIMLTNFRPGIIWKRYLPPEELVNAIASFFDFLGLPYSLAEIDGFGIFEQLSGAVNNTSSNQLDGMPVFLSSAIMSKEQKVDMIQWFLFDDYQIGPDKDLGAYLADKEDFFKNGDFTLFPGGHEEYLKLINYLVETGDNKGLRDILLCG